MSPAQVYTQRAVVLHGQKDLRLEDRPNWPPSYNHAQVAVKATGLCGSDRTSCSPSSSIINGAHLPRKYFLQCITTLTVATVTLISKPRSFWVMSRRESSCQSDQERRIFSPDNEWLSKPELCANIAITVAPVVITSAKACGSQAAPRPSPTLMGRCKTA